MKINSLLLSLVLVLGIGTFAFATFTGGANLEDPYTADYLLSQDTIPLKDRYGDFVNDPINNPFDLNDPGIIEQTIEYDPESEQYIISEKIGDDYFRMPTYMTYDEYMQWSAEQQQQEYFQQLAGVSSGSKGSSGLSDPLEKIDVQRDVIERLFGGTKVDIRPQGNIDLTFGVDFQRVANPTLPLRQQKQGGFDFDMAIQMSATGQIGEKLKLGFNYNTQATFDFENQMKLEYVSDNFSEDEIIKKIEAGHVSLPLRGQLIQGAQSLFGLKTELQFGKLRLTAIASQQKSKRENIKIQGGAQVQEFEVTADQYDENRHFFLSHYNRAVFEDNLEGLPQITSLFRVSEIQVWITNDRNETINVRDIVAVADLGESTRITNDNPLYQLPPTPRHPDIFGQNALPGLNLMTDIDANDIHRDLRDNPRARQLNNAVSVLQNEFRFDQSKDFEKISARLLTPNEYTIHPELGFISINVNLRPDQILGVAYTYEYNGETYKVGEFSNDNYSTPDSLNPLPPQEVIFVKMLKSTTPRIDLPAWDLMMKNVYSIGAFQVSQEDFRLDIFYEDPGGGEKRFLPEPGLENKPLLKIFNLDRLNTQGDPFPDGQFDFVKNVTINPQNGRIMFPVLEPFGSSLANGIAEEGIDPTPYTYQMLYDSTITRAREYPEFNRFIVRGSYKSSVSSEISLGAFNLPEGSVTVRAGGRVLTEGQDYEIDYNIGRLRILNDAYTNSGQPIDISFEDNTLFGFQTKTLLGLRADYEISKNLNVGGTYMHLFERPFTQKVNIGDDPISNRIYGLDVNYSKEAPWLTKLVDKIPFIETKEKSNITFSAEAAFLRPGHAKAINANDGKGGIVYIDDFEGSTSGFTLTTPTVAWSLASVPQDDAQGNNNLFPESKLLDNTDAGVNRAHVSWYRVETLFANDDNVVSSPYTDNISQLEIFPNQNLQPGLNNQVQSLNLSYFPEERGAYNFDVPGGTTYSAGLDASGALIAPETRWGGIMRSLNTNDFEAANVEYIEFWLLNPFMQKPGGAATDGGDLYIELGNISEDLLRDSRKFFENGIPTDNNTAVDQTNWGKIPRTPAITNAFVNDPDKRVLQDVGFDGVGGDDEQIVFQDYFNTISGPGLSDAARTTILSDLSNDDFLDPRSSTDPILLNRYKRAANPEGNSPVATGGSSVLGKQTPDTEDLNQDNTLNETESYWQYKIPMEIGPTDPFTGEQTLELSEYVTDVRQDSSSNRTWYRFKIPLDQNAKRVGGIQDFRSIRFMRMYLHGFKDPITFRFATLELVRNQWRRYRREVQVYVDPPVIALPEESATVFDVNAVSVQENDSKIPFGYVLPLGIQQEQSTNSTFADVLENEQSLAMEFCGLQPQTAQGIYKIINLDMRIYDQMEMFVHAEANDPMGDLNAIDDGELSAFIRIGSDFEKNYYEYELPLTMSRDNSLGTDTDAYKEEVWKAANDFEIDFEIFKSVKVARNDAGHPLNEPYEVVSDAPSGKEVKIRVKGNPNLGNVKGAMIGVINRSDRPHCAEVWVNELRVSGIDERGGAAALARVDFQLADFGAISASGSFSSIGWGQLEQKALDRQREQIYQYDIAGNFELGKFLPEKSGIRIPAYVQYSNTVSTPEFDPYDLDITLKDKLNKATTTADRDSIRDQAIDQEEIRSLNFTNVRKEVTNKDKLQLPWNIENFSLTYAYTETKSHDPIIENDELTTHSGILNYDYSRPTTFITPFKKLIKKDKYLKLISELNFNPLPNIYSFSTTMNRTFHATTYRFVGDDPFFNTFYNKKFTWDRDYSLGWDITKALKFNFSAINRSIIDEKEEYYTDEEDVRYGTRRSRSTINDDIWNSIQSGGRTKGYNHDFSIDYTLPLKKIPFLDFITVKASYQADYSWDNPSAFNPEPPGYKESNWDSLGYVITNGQTRRLNGDLNFETLYNKSKFLKKINKKTRGGSKKGRRKGRGSKNSDKGGDDKKGGGSDKKGKRGDTVSTGRDDRNSKTETKDAALDKNGGKNKGRGSTGGGIGTAGADTGGGSGALQGGKKKKKKKKGDGEPSKLTRALVRPLLMLRKGRLTYTENRSTVVPGFTPQSKYLGMTQGFGAPGFGFVAGFQPFISDNDNSNDWLTQSANKGWITDNTFQNQKVVQNYQQTIEGRLTVEPFADFKIDIDAKRSFTENSSLYFKDVTPRLLNGEPDIAEIVHLAPRDVGSYTMSYFALNTLFNNDIVELFGTFEDNREIISTRLGTVTNPDDPGYTEGYGRTQQDVLLPAFLAAYTDKDPNTVKISDDYASNVLFKSIPKLNWQLSYSGLGKMQVFKELFSSVNITHGYRSTLTVNSFSTDQDFNSQQVFQTNDLGNFYSRFEIPALVINETFSPLFGIDMRFKNDMTFRIDYKKARNLAMSFNIDYSLNETKTTEFIFGYGYRMKNVIIPFLLPKNKRPKKRKGKKKKKKSTKPGKPGATAQKGNDLNFKFDFSFRDDITIVHKLDQGIAEPTRGSKRISISPSIDYDVNKQLNLRLFFERSRTIPATSASYPITNTAAGLTIRFSLN